MTPLATLLCQEAEAARFQGAHDLARLLERAAAELGKRAPIRPVLDELLQRVHTFAWSERGMVRGDGYGYVSRAALRIVADEYDRRTA